MCIKCKNENILKYEVGDDYRWSFMSVTSERRKTEW